jgi:hypothetical protein
MLFSSLSSPSLPIFGLTLLRFICICYMLTDFERSVVAFSLVPHQYPKYGMLSTTSATTTTHDYCFASFGASTRRQPVIDYGFSPKIRCAVVPTPYFAENNNNNDSNNKAKNNEATAETESTAKADAVVTTSTPTTTTTSSPSLFQLLDEAAQQLKPAAVSASEKAIMYNNSRQRGMKYRYLIQSCVLYSLFLCYRAYRGFFVILPAVFQETFRKLRLAVDDKPFDNTTNDNNTDISNAELFTSSTKNMKLRTRITISILTTFVTLAYVVGGAIRVLSTMIRSTIHGASISQSLQNAIQMYEQNESSLLRKTTTDLSGVPPPTMVTVQHPSTSTMSSTTTSSSSSLLNTINGATPISPPDDDYESIRNHEGLDP